jgi:hypothetical protein
MPARRHISLKKREVMKLYRLGFRSIKGMAVRLHANTIDGRALIRRILKSEGCRLKRYIWTREEIAILRKHYPHIDGKVLAKKLNRPITSIYGKANILGLRKSAEWLRKKREYWIRLLLRTGKAHRFKEGHPTWNEGLKGLKYPGRKTGQFKKGEPSKRWQGYRNGTISIRREKTGQLYKCIRLGPGKWEPLHHHRWKKAHRPLPKGKLLVFKNRDSLDCRLSNLMLIDRKTHGARWSLTAGGIAKALACIPGGKGKINSHLFHQALKNPALLEAKRRQLELQRTIDAQ